MTSTQIVEAGQSLYDAAVEMMADDPDVTASWTQFCDVMWTDDHDMNTRGLSREDYRLALQWAWEKLPH